MVSQQQPRSGYVTPLDVAIPESDEGQEEEAESDLHAESDPYLGRAASDSELGFRAVTVTKRKRIRRKGRAHPYVKEDTKVESSPLGGA